MLLLLTERKREDGRFITVQVFAERSVGRRNQDGIGLARRRPGQPEIFRRAGQYAQCRPRKPPRRPETPASSAPVAAQYRRMEHAHRGSPVLMSRSELFRSYEDVRPQGFQQFTERVRTQRRAHQHDAHRRHDRMAQFGHDAGISGGFCTRRAPGEGHGRSDVRRQERPAASVRRRDVRLRRKGAGHQIQRRGERREGDFQRRPAPRQGSGLQPDGPQRPDYDGAEPDGPSGKRKVAASRSGRTASSA